MRLNRILILILTSLLLLLLAVPQAFAQECSEQDCPGAMTNPIAASYATIGYWTLADILRNMGGLTQTDFNPDSAPDDISDSYVIKWGALIYILTIIAALIMMALGQPPKMYGWYAAGPALFYFLLFTPANLRGVRWQLGENNQDQRVVWEMSRTGLSSLSIIDNTPVLGGSFDEDGPSGTIRVPWLFYAIDSVSTEVVQNFIKVFGLGRELQPVNGTQKPEDASKWQLLSMEKWELLENITMAKIFNTDLRELLVSFMASECGDKVGEYIEKGKFVSVSNSSGEVIPRTLLRSREELLKELSIIRLPVPYVFTQLAKDTSDSSFPVFATQTVNTGDLELGGNQADVSQFQGIQTITCDDWLWLVVQGLRWESGIHYGNLKKSLDLPVHEKDQSRNRLISDDLMNYVFLYDWKFTPEDGASGNSNMGPQNEKEREIFMINMVLAYMMRNELAVAPQLVEQRILPADKTSDFANENSRNINGKNKFAEFYTWAKMMPHIQGLLIYILAIGYPLACVMILVPGWWKWIFTWLSFYLWAKSWDIGFAIVQSIEKSIWATIGNSLNASKLNGKIWTLQDTPDGFQGLDVFVAGKNPESDAILASGVADNIVYVRQSSGVNGGNLSTDSALDIFDHALILSRVLNHDLANSYYIYLMSALYFAVPAITGQVLLGAKAGMANFVKEAIGGTAQETAGAAKAGAVAEETRHGSISSQVADQQFNAKASRKDGLALRAIQDKNQAMGLEIDSGRIKGLSAQEGLVARMSGDRAQLISGINQGMTSIMSMKAAAFGAAMSGWKEYVLNTHERAVMNEWGNSGGIPEQNQIDQDVNKILSNNGSTQTSSSGNGLHSDTGGKASDKNAGETSSPKPQHPDKVRTKPVQVMDGLFGLATQYPALMNAMANYRAAKTNLAATKYSLEANQKAREMESLSGVTDFDYGNRARALTEASSRIGQAASFRAKESAFRQQAQFSRHLSGKMAARGVSPGAFDPKGKETNLDTIGAGGMLGGNYKKAYDYPMFGVNSKISEGTKQLQAAAARAQTQYYSDIKVDGYGQDADFYTYNNIAHDGFGKTIADTVSSGRANIENEAGLMRNEDNVRTKNDVIETNRTATNAVMNTMQGGIFIPKAFKDLVADHITN